MNKPEYKVGDPVTSPKHGSGRVHMITEDKDYPIVVKFDKYPPANYYYSPEGKGLDSSCGTIQRV